MTDEEYKTIWTDTTVPSNWDLYWLIGWFAVALAVIIGAVIW